jgi:hypothetical protein
MVANLRSTPLWEIPVQEFEFAMQLASILVVLLVVTGVALDLRRLCSVSLTVCPIRVHFGRARLCRAKLRVA